MKKYIFFFLVGFVLLVFSIYQLYAWNVTTLSGGVSAKGCGSVGEYDENFEQSEYCHADLATNETVSGDPTNAITGDGTPAQGTYACEIDVNDEAGDCYTYDVITENTNNATPMYYKFDVRVDNSFGAQWADLWILLLQDGGTTPNHPVAINFYAKDMGATASIFCRVTLGTVQQEDGLAFDTYHTVKVKVNDDQDVAGVEWKVNDVAQTTAVGASDLQEDTVFLGGGAGQHATEGLIHVDNFIQSLNPTDVGW